MKIRANAKINLTLDIIDKRKDGYHIIDSVMQSISLADTVIAEKSDSITVDCNCDEIISKNNIAFKAAQKFFEFTGVCGGVKLQIEKHIPLASGMGGGSADAAAVILALDKIYKTNLSKTQLREIALSVGADVPFCIEGGTARIGGIGEKIDKLPDMPQCEILLIKHGVKQSTADMYKKTDSCPAAKRYTNSAVGGILNGDINEICDNLSNAFSAVCDNSKLINDIKTTLPLAVSLSGSGPTVFAIYKDTVEVTSALNRLKSMGYDPIIATPVGKGIIFE